MGEQTNNRQALKLKAETLTDAETSAVLDYIEMIQSLREPALRSEAADDDLVNLLSEAQENRRARVVMEWDRVRLRADTRAAARKIS
jgi:hypothetical protein